MRRLHLIRHGQPVIDPHLPSHLWTVSERVREQARAAAERLRRAPPRAVVASEEPKARTTGELIAEVLGIPCRSLAGLHEHLRRSQPFRADPGAFEADVCAVFARPGERAMGEESADEAHARFLEAVTLAMETHRGDLAIVAHGTVISLLVARANALDAAVFWRSFGLGEVVTVDWPRLALTVR